MKIAFTLSHMDNYALNETRKWEFITALRSFHGYVLGQKLDSYDALDMIGGGNLPYFVDEFGCVQISFPDRLVPTREAGVLTFDQELILHALRTHNSRSNLITALRAAKDGGGAAGVKQVKTLAKHFKEMLDRTEW